MHTNHSQKKKKNKNVILNIKIYEKKTNKKNDQIALQTYPPAYALFFIILIEYYIYNKFFLFGIEQKKLSEGN